MYYDVTIDERVKGIQYAQQPEFVQIVNKTEVRFVGSHVPHTLIRTAQGWECDCDKFNLIANSNYPSPYCAHVIAVERFIECTDGSTFKPGERMEAKQ